VLGFSLLEAVNYLEHYGLARQQLPNGDGSASIAAQLEHNHIVTNVLLYHLQRHSDHQPTHPPLPGAAPL